MVVLQHLAELFVLPVLLSDSGGEPFLLLQHFYLVLIGIPVYGTIFNCLQDRAPGLIYMKTVREPASCRKIIYITEGSAQSACIIRQSQLFHARGVNYYPSVIQDEQLAVLADHPGNYRLILVVFSEVRLQIF